MRDPYKKDSVLLIKDLETLKVISDPLRIQILELLAPKPQTVTQVAESLGISSSRLYYHFKMLETHNLIKVVETRLVNNMIERDYGLVAEEIRIDKDLLSFSSEEGQENLIQMVRSSWEATLEDMMRNLKVHQSLTASDKSPYSQEMVMLKLQSRLSPTAYKEFIEKLNNLMEEFNHPNQELEGGEESQEYHLACFIYPSFLYDEEEDLNNESDTNG